MRSASPVALILLAFGLVPLGGSLYLSSTFRASDFLGFYAGATLGPRGQTFNAGAIEKLEKTYGQPDKPKPFHRPPFYALAIAPLALLPYRWAFALWQMLNVFALAIFVRLWPVEHRLLALLLSLWFLPLWIALGIAQDSAILLAWLALSAWFLRRDRAFLCGVVLAICCFKANLLVAIPIVLIVRRMGRVCAGFAAGGAVLWLISAIAAGPGWLLDYIAAIQHTRQVLPMQTNFASMAGLVQSLPDGWRWIRWPVVLAIVCVLWSASRRVSEDRALSLALMAGLLMTPFAFLYDAAVMLPGIIGASEDRDPVLPCVFVALGLASLNVINPQTAWIGQCSLVLSFGLAVWSVH